MYIALYINSVKIIINMLLLYLLQSTNSLVIKCIVCCVADPNSVELNIDGTTDMCSKGEDINFIFTGFTLSGKVGLNHVIHVQQQN